MSAVLNIPDRTFRPPLLAIVLILIHDLFIEDGTRLERDEEHINNLTADFEKRQLEKPEEHPVQTPLRVLQRTDKYLVVAGSNRLLAARRAGLRNLPCIILPGDLDEAGLLIEQAKDNEMHKAYTPLERARNVLLVAEKRGCSPAQAGKLLGIRSASDVTKMLKVLSGYPQDLWPLIGEGDGRVPFTTSYTLARLHPNEAKIRELTDRVVKGLLTRDSAEEEVAHILAGGKKPKDKPLFIKFDGFELKAKKPTAESVKAFIDKLAAALKRLAGGDINDLPFHFKTS